MTSTTEEILEKLVAFDTTSDRSNLPLLAYVQDWLAGHGVTSTLIPDETGDKANLFATIGPADRPGIALSGHVDCVPVEGQPWDTDPFVLTERNGRLYGRGSCDMKGFDACVLALVPEMVKAGLKTPIHIALSHDEEMGCIGVRSMIARLGRDLPMPLATIVGEPTRMEVVDAHKGIADFETTVIGVEAHSSILDTGANAILAAVELIGELTTIRDEVRGLGDPTGRFTPGWTTVHVGRINGGTASNIVPRRCAFQWEIRAIPGFDESIIRDRFAVFAREEVLPGLREISPDTSIETEVLVEAPALAPAPGSAAERIALHAAGRNATATVSYMTEAGLFQIAGSPAIVCGPGDIAQAHKPNEFIEISQLRACEAFLRRVIASATAGL
ncbi:MAG: acetylornithine deacetylase [Flavobacteriaceae bacterium]